MTAQNLDLSQQAQRMAEKRQGVLPQEQDTSFNLLFHEHWAPLCRFLYRLTGSMADAEDLALETFWRLWKQPYSKIQQPKAWLYRVGINLGYNSFRARDRRIKYESQVILDRDDESKPLSPEDAVEGKDRQERVREALHRMKPRQAKILLLRHADFSYQEIAETLEINPHSVGKMLARAEERFVKLYQEEERQPDAPKR